jgi:hypothetical protein
VVQFRANATGGTSPLQYEWLFGDGTSSTVEAPQHGYGANGGYTVLLWVNDSVGGSIERSFALEVFPNSTAPAAAPFWENPYFWGALVAVAGAGAAGVLLLRRRGAAPPESPPEPDEEAPSE